jgi:hypothetical protein
MLSKCANPTCSASFRLLHEGRIFNLAIPEPTTDANQYPRVTIEHYWLCRECSQTLKVMVDFGLAVVCPRHLQLAEGTPVIADESKPHAA